MSRCPACGSSPMTRFLGPIEAPVHCNVLLESRADALAAPIGTIELAACERCAMIANVAFVPELTAYEGEYENALHFSSVFRDYAERSARRLVADRGVRGGCVVEIGCGDGHFLGLLCERGDNRGLGLDPSQPTRADAGGRYRIVGELFRPGPHLPTPDLLCARHVLEHVHDPRELLRGVFETLGERPGASLYVEVPDAGFMLRENALWDVIYEHCSYFARPSLSRLLAATGFRVLRAESGFGGQFLEVDAAPDGRDTPSAGDRGLGRGREAPAHAGPALPREDREAAELLSLAPGFEAARRQEIERWSAMLDRLFGAGRRFAVWGAGSKGTTFLNAVPGARQAVAVIDINPRKHGRHVPGTGHPVASPEQLRETPVDDVLLMNANYEREVAEELGRLGVRAEVHRA